MGVGFWVFRFCCCGSRTENLTESTAGITTRPVIVKMLGRFLRTLQPQKLLCRTAVTASTRNKFKATSGAAPVDFSAKSEDVLNLICKALQPIVEHNPGYEIFRETSDTEEGGSVTAEVSLDCTVRNKGVYVFKIDFQAKCMVVQTPVTGLYTYTYDGETDQWLSTLDGHDFRGLVTRDILRQQTLGIPKW